MAREDLLNTQLAALERSYPGAQLHLAADGSHVVTAPVPLPPGWSDERTTVAFVVPHAYPAAQLDCFYADPDLRLAGGAMPANSGIQPLEGQPQLWFSWHLRQPWNPTQHSLLTYIRFITERLARVS